MPSIGIDSRISSALTAAGVTNFNQGTLAFLTVKKKGVTRGGLTYDDDVVQVLIWTGFSYWNLGERSLVKYHNMLPEKLISKVHAAVEAETGRKIPFNDVCEAVQEMGASLNGFSGKPSSLEDDEDQPMDWPSNWEPLELQGQRVRGAKVYIGPRKGNMNPGQVYLQGMKVAEKVLEPAVNGHWTPKPNNKTAAKNLLKSWLPLGHYCQYILDPIRVSSLKVGRDATKAAKDAGLEIDPEKIRTLFV